MSENTIPQAADETPEAQLTEGQLEEAAGGTSVIEDAINPILETVQRWFT